MKPVARSLAALSLLGVLCLGSVCHTWHHLIDHACGAAESRGAQPCASCSALHGGSIATEPQIDVLPDFRPTTGIPQASFVSPRAAEVSAAAPRGPPTA